MDMKWKKSVRKTGSLYKLALYDIRAGFRNNRIKLAVFTGLCMFICMMGIRTISGVIERNDINATVMDYICYMIGGPKHIPQGMLDLYVMPVLWLALQVMIAYVTGYYAVTDLHTYGQQVLIRSASRCKWWLCKCIWNMVTVLVMYAIIYSSSVAAAFCSGAVFMNRLTPEIALSVCNMDMAGGSNLETAFILLVMPVLTSLSLSMAQMTVALVTSPVIGFIASQSIVFASTIYEYKFLIPNYGMLSHNKITCMSGIEYQDGIVICIVVFVISLAAGMMYFRNCNILPKNQEI